MSTSPDAKAVVRAAEALTTQVRRIADALTTTAAQAVADASSATQTDYALAPAPVDDEATTAPAEQCAARWHPSGPEHANQLPTACIRPARHVEDHADGSGFHWTDAVAIWPAESPFAAADEDDPPGASCRRMETRTCPPSYNGPCGERPCARFESDDPGPWLDTAETPAADEDAQRTARRASLRNLLDRAARSLLTRPEEATLLRQHVDTEMREADTARAVAAGNKRHVQVMYAELEQANEAARKALEQRQQMAEERYVIQGQRDTADQIRAEAQRDRDQHAAVLIDVLHSFAKVLSDDEQRVIGFMGPTADPETFERWSSVIAPTVERPWWEQVEEAQAAVKRVRSLLAGCWGTVDPDRVRAALDGTEQPTTTET